MTLNFSMEVRLTHNSAMARLKAAGNFDLGFVSQIDQAHISSISEF